MPQPFILKKGTACRNYQSLWKRPECAVRIAVIASASAQLEGGLAGLVAQAAATQADYLAVQGIPGSYGIRAQMNQVAYEAVRALESMSARLDVIRAVLKISVSQELCDEFEVIATRVRRTASARNAVIHCVWAVSDERPDDLLAPGNSPGQFMRYTVKDLDDIIKRISGEIGAVEVFGMKCLEHLAARAQPGGPPPAAPLPALSQEEPVGETPRLGFEGGD